MTFLTPQIPNPPRNWLGSLHRGQWTERSECLTELGQPEAWESSRAVPEGVAPAGWGPVGNHGSWLQDWKAPATKSQLGPFLGFPEGSSIFCTRLRS